MIQFGTHMLTMEVNISGLATVKEWKQQNATKISNFINFFEIIDKTSTK